jgi:hypothetical protein
MTPKATSAIATAASPGEREATVPSDTNTPPVSASAACACSRALIGPGKSTSSSIANEPKAANVATAGLAITTSPSANMAGMTSAARAPDDRALNRGSRAPSHATADAYAFLPRPSSTSRA